MLFQICGVDVSVWARKTADAGTGIVLNHQELEALVQELERRNTPPDEVVACNHGFLGTTYYTLGTLRTAISGDDELRVKLFR